MISELIVQVNKISGLVVYLIPTCNPLRRDKSALFPQAY